MGKRPFQMGARRPDRLRTGDAFPGIRRRVHLSVQTVRMSDALPIYQGHVPQGAGAERIRSCDGDIQVLKVLRQDFGKVLLRRYALPSRSERQMGMVPLLGSERLRGVPVQITLGYEKNRNLHRDGDGHEDADGDPDGGIRRRTPLPDGELRIPIERFGESGRKVGGGSGLRTAVLTGESPVPHRRSLSQMNAHDRRSRSQVNVHDRQSGGVRGVPDTHQGGIAALRWNR